MFPASLSKQAALLLEELEQRTNTILEAAADAVILMDESGAIQVFNKAAEAMFGYSRDEALESSIRIIMPVYDDGTLKDDFLLGYLADNQGRRAGADTGTKREVKGRRKDGSEFSMQISLSRGAVRDKTFSVAIIRDITDQKEKERALEASKARSETLLLNVLPAAIAEDLKLNGGPIADYYDDVTILLSDIVGFTALSSTISASELVDMLNRIFSMFDELADRYRLEKIKTIGDAYMLVR